MPWSTCTRQAKDVCACRLGEGCGFVHGNHARACRTCEGCARVGCVRSRGYVSGGGGYVIVIGSGGEMGCGCRADCYVSHACGPPFAMMMHSTGYVSAVRCWRRFGELSGILNDGVVTESASVYSACSGLL